MPLYLRVSELRLTQPKLQSASAEPANIKRLKDCSNRLKDAPSITMTVSPTEVAEEDVVALMLIRSRMQ